MGVSYAVFKTGGKQYRATEGDLVTVEKLDAEEGASVEFDQVLLVGEGADVKVGTPFVEGGKVTGTVESQFKDRKVNVIKFKRRQGYRRTLGHRQRLTRIRVTGIHG